MHDLSSTVYQLYKRKFSRKDGDSEAAKEKDGAVVNEGFESPEMIETQMKGTYKNIELWGHRPAGPS